jgi:hypothetical protein
MRKLNIFCWAVVIFAFSYFGGHFAYWLLIDATEPKAYREMTDQERAESKRLFKKHGNSAAVCSHDGTNCYFIRNGKKMRWM